MKSLYIIFACLCWACDTLIRYPLQFKGYNAIDIVFFEHVFALGILILFFYKKISWSFLKANFFNFLMIGTFGSAIATLSFTQAFQILNPSVVILLQKLQPVVAIVLSVFLLNEKINKRFLFGAFFCLVGAIVLSCSDFLINGSWEIHSFRGLILVTVSIFGWAFATVFGKKVSLKENSVIKIMQGRFIFGLLGLSPFFIFNSEGNILDVYFFKEVSFLVFISALLAMYFYYRGMQYIPAKVVTIYELFFPLLAVLVNWIFLGQSLNVLQIIGAAILIFGSFFVEKRSS